jgi:pyruvate formate-lyase activating enzyme-like uncharacterized protein
MPGCTRVEQGPIRPPNESRSLLLRLTRNCPWNLCLFCPVYKKRRFSFRSDDEIISDINCLGKIRDEIISESEFALNGHLSDEYISKILHRPGISLSYRMVLNWLYYQTKSCFLQDADNLIMKTGSLVNVLEYLKRTFPELNRITTYSRSRTINKKSIQELEQIRKAGLNRLHIGLESGYDPILKRMKKGITAQGHIDAAKKAINAGLEVSVYVMPGLGGREFWQEHAQYTAEVINQIKPHFIRLRTLFVVEGSPLYQELSKGDFKPQTDDQLAEELLLFVTSLKGINSRLTSDHATNLFENLEGDLGREKESLENIIRKYQELTEQQRLVYRVGRRGGQWKKTDDLFDQPDVYKKIQGWITEMTNSVGLEGIEEELRQNLHIL